MRAVNMPILPIFNYISVQFTRIVKNISMFPTIPMIAIAGSK